MDGNVETDRTQTSTKVEKITLAEVNGLFNRVFSEADRDKSGALELAEIRQIGAKDPSAKEHQLARLLEANYSSISRLTFTPRDTGSADSSKLDKQGITPADMDKLGKRITESEAANKNLSIALPNGFPKLELLASAPDPIEAKQKRESPAQKELSPPQNEETDYRDTVAKLEQFVRDNMTKLDLNKDGGLHIDELYKGYPWDGKNENHFNALLDNYIKLARMDSMFSYTIAPSDMEKLPKYESLAIRTAVADGNGTYETRDIRKEQERIETKCQTIVWENQAKFRTLANALVLGDREALTKAVQDIPPEDLQFFANNLNDLYHTTIHLRGGAGAHCGYRIKTEVRRNDEVFSAPTDSLVISVDWDNPGASVELGAHSVHLPTNKDLLPRGFAKGWGKVDHEGPSGLSIYVIGRNIRNTLAGRRPE